MTDDGSGPDEVFDAWAQTAIVPPPLASRDHRDLSAILTRGSRDGPSVSQTPRKDWGWPEACGEGNTIRVSAGIPIHDAHEIIWDHTAMPRWVTSLDSSLNKLLNGSMACD
jgi:hypothetical protein